MWVSLWIYHIQFTGSVYTHIIIPLRNLKAVYYYIKKSDIFMHMYDMYM